MQPKKKIPKVRIGEVWLPAHKIWKVVESLNTATDMVERYNETRPTLTTPITEEVVDRVRARIRDMEMRTGGEGVLKAAAEAAIAAAAEEAAAADQARRGSNTVESAADGGQHGSNEVITTKDGSRLPREVVRDAARQVLEAMPLEDAMRMLEEDYGEKLAINQLIDLIGQDNYHAALVREAQDFSANKIAPDQIAFLWNESGIARPSGGLWTEQDIAALMA